MATVDAATVDGGLLRDLDVGAIAMELAGAVTVVTGATRGIGRASAIALARRGASVVLVGRSTQEAPNRGGLPGTLQSVAEEITAAGGAAVTVAADLSKPDDVQRVIDATNDRFGRCDVLVNNAALSFLGPFLDVPPRRWLPVVNVNLLAPVTLIHAFLPGMTERGDGRIINVTSAAAQTRGGPAGGVHQLPYAATKAGLDALSYGLAGQLAGSGVAVNLLSPSVLTEAVTFHVTDPGQLAAMSARMAAPDAYGEAVAWLAMQPATYTGNYLSNDDLVAAGALTAS